MDKKTSKLGIFFAGNRLTSVQVLTLTDNSQCSAYDCEFVALAKQLSVKLVTQDKKILREFPEVAVSLDDFLNQVSSK